MKRYVVYIDEAHLFPVPYCAEVIGETEKTLKVKPCDIDDLYVGSRLNKTRCHKVFNKYNKAKKAFDKLIRIKEEFYEMKSIARCGMVLMLDKGRKE